MRVGPLNLEPPEENPAMVRDDRAVTTVAADTPTVAADTSTEVQAADNTTSGSPVQESADGLNGAPGSPEATRDNARLASPQTHGVLETPTTR